MKATKGVERLKEIKGAQEVKTFKGVKTVLWFILRIFISGSHDNSHYHPHDTHCNTNRLDRRKEKRIQTTRERITSWSVLTKTITHSKST